MDYILQPSNIPQFKPFDLKFISKNANAKDIEEGILRERYILVTRSGTIGRLMYIGKMLDGWAGSDDLIRIVPSDQKFNPGYIVAFLTTPYGQYQLSREMYGSVIQHLEAEHLGAIWIPDVPKYIQLKIGDLIIEAYEKRDEANEIEEAAISRLENILMEKTNVGLDTT